MKKASRNARSSTGELRAEYTFDYAKAAPNRYAERLQGRTVAVVLDPDVAAAFPDSKAVNRQLRAAVAPVPRRSRKRVSRRAPGGRSGRNEK